MTPAPFRNQSPVRCQAWFSINLPTRAVEVYTAQINSTCSAQLNVAPDSQQRELTDEMHTPHSGHLRAT